MTEKTYAFELDDDENDEEGRGALQSGVYDDEDEEMDEYDEDEWDEDDEEEDETEEEEDLAGPAVAGTSTADSRVLPLAGDEEDAEGEMEADLEAFTDPSFNAELSVSPGATPPPRGAAPLPPPAPPLPLKEQTNFYVRMDSPAMQMQTQMQYGSASPPHWDTPPALVQASAYDDGGQGDLQQQQSEEHLHQPQQHQHPVEIQLTPAPPQAYFTTPPVLPLPPPRLDSIRVGYLRQSELGAKLTGRGTPADRARAAQWARGYAAWCAAQDAAAKAAPRNEQAESAQAKEQNGSPPRDTQDEQAVDGPMRLTLGARPLRSRVVGEGNNVAWEVFLTDPIFEEPISSSSASDLASGSARDELRRQEHQPHHEMVSAPIPEGSGAYSTPREPGSSSGAGDIGAGGEGLFQMGMFGGGFASLLPQAWLDSPVAAATTQGLIVGEQDGHGGAAAGTSTLSFALG